MTLIRILTARPATWPGELVLPCSDLSPSREFAARHDKGLRDDRPGEDLAERGGERARGSPVAAGWRQAMNRSGRTRTAPSLAFCRWRCQVQRGSYDDTLLGAGMRST